MLSLPIIKVLLVKLSANLFENSLVAVVVNSCRWGPLLCRGLGGWNATFLNNHLKIYVF